MKCMKNKIKWKERAIYYFGLLIAVEIIIIAVVVAYVILKLQNPQLLDNIISNIPGIIENIKKMIKI